MLTVVGRTNMGYVGKTNMGYVGKTNITEAKA
jgi:hypothetical protein